MYISPVFSCRVTFTLSIIYHKEIQPSTRASYHNYMNNDVCMYAGACGKIGTNSFGGGEYFVIFVDGIHSNY